jgi:hypothetical protein
MGEKPGEIDQAAAVDQDQLTTVILHDPEDNDDSLTTVILHDPAE